MNTTSKFTPGPWGFPSESADPEWSVITTSGGVVIANVNADHRQVANARLIAAAPELLHALKAFINCIDAMHPSVKSAFDGEVAAEYQAQARAAIAKATS